MSGAPPTMSSANLGLRFALEIGAIIGIGGLMAEIADNIVLTYGVPLLAIVAWGVFNVPDDPSRSGRAPVPVSGWIRLALELTIFAAGIAGMLLIWSPVYGIIAGGLVIVHYIASHRRVQWLILQESE